MQTPEILILREPIGLEKAQELASAWHGDMLKGVADCRRGVIALGGDWHMDAHAHLVLDGSSPEDVWGFNLYPDAEGEEALEYISLINIRPRQGNHEMELKDPLLRELIRGLLKKPIPSLGL